MKRGWIFCVLWVLLALLQGSAAEQPRVFMLSDFYDAKLLPYDSPPQVIYRIDDHRFVTLERYRDCNHGDTYYNDTRAGIRKSLGRGSIENFQGRLINADPTGINLVFPSSGPPHMVCSDRGCNVPVLYSTDGGRTFHAISYMNSFDPFEDSKDYTIVATKDALYVAQKISETTGHVVTDHYPLIPGFADNGRDALPGGARVSFNTTMPSGLRTPFGRDHLTCDASIKPTNPDASLNQDSQ
jgi:hypothetical protein